jgi:hypothetical protein
LPCEAWARMRAQRRRCKYQQSWATAVSSTCDTDYGPCVLGATEDTATCVCSSNALCFCSLRTSSTQTRHADCKEKGDECSDEYPCCKGYTCTDGACVAPTPPPPGTSPLKLALLLCLCHGLLLLTRILHTDHLASPLPLLVCQTAVLSLGCNLESRLPPTAVARFLHQLPAPHSQLSLCPVKLACLPTVRNDSTWGGTCRVKHWRECKLSVDDANTNSHGPLLSRRVILTTGLASLEQ